MNFSGKGIEMVESLALFGGIPVRKESYPVHTTNLSHLEEEEVLKVMRGGHLSGFSARPGERFLGGPMVQELERRFAAHLGVEYAVSFNSATSALHGTIAAAKIGPGDEVIVPPTTMSATASAVLMQNAIPVFADIEDETFGLDPRSVENAITQRTKAILTVNLFGHPSRLDALEKIAEKYSLILIEDNAQALGAQIHGRTAGTVGVMGVQSLNYHKTIQTGEGGVVITNDNALAKHLQLMRNHGEVVIRHMDDTTDDALVNMLGWNYRLGEIPAAIGIHQVGKIEELTRIRIELAGIMTEKLADFDFLVPPAVRQDCSHVYYLYPMRFITENIGISRALFAKAMRAEGISISEGYVIPIYLEPMYQKRVVYGRKGCPFNCHQWNGDVSYEQGRCPTAERLYFDEFVLTDICKFPNTINEVEEFIRAVRKIADNIEVLRKEER